MTYTVLGSLIDIVRLLKIIHADLGLIQTRMLTLAPDGQSEMTARPDADGNRVAAGDKGQYPFRNNKPRPVRHFAGRTVRRLSAF